MSKTKHATVWTMISCGSWYSHVDVVPGSWRTLCFDPTVGLTYTIRLDFVDSRLLNRHDDVATNIVLSSCRLPDDAHD